MDNVQAHLSAASADVSGRLACLEEAVRSLLCACESARLVQDAVQRQVQAVASANEACLGLAHAASVQPDISALAGALAETQLATHGDMAAAVASLNAGFQAVQQRLRAGEAAASNMGLLADIYANRWHNQTSSALLQLPDAALHAIAKHASKRLRRVCTALRDALGSPGAGLAPPCTSSPALGTALAAWPFPAGVTHLHLSSELLHLDPAAWTTTVSLLPQLRTLSCHSLGLPAGPTPPSGLTGLTLVHPPADLSSIPAAAPHLQSLHLLGPPPASDPTRPADAATHPADLIAQNVVWDALLALPSIASLHVHLDLRPAPGPSALFATLARLTALTHLGLEFTPQLRVRGGDLGAALAQLRALRGLELVNCGVLRESLAPALQRLPLRALALSYSPTCTSFATDSSNACTLPDFSAMPALTRLRLHTDAAGVGYDPVVPLVPITGACGGLRCLEYGAAIQQASVMMGMLGCCPGLTRLALMSECGKCLETRDTDFNMASLAKAVAALTDLRELDLDTGFEEMAAAVAQLPALRRLVFSPKCKCGSTRGIRSLGGLTGLRQLSIGEAGPGPRKKLGLLAAAGRLPLLEELHLGITEWGPEELRSMLPLGGCLTRVLVDRWQQVGACSVLEGHVEVGVRKCEARWGGCDPF